MLDTEAHDPASEQFGEERLSEALEATRESTGDQVLDRVRTDIKAFSGSAPQFDDITMVVLSINE